MGHLITNFKDNNQPLHPYRKIILILSLMSILAEGCISGSNKITNEKMVKLSKNSNSKLIIIIPNFEEKHSGGMKIRINDIDYLGRYGCEFRIRSGETYKLNVPDGHLQIGYSLHLPMDSIFNLYEGGGKLQIDVEKNQEVLLTLVKEGEVKQELSFCTIIPFVWPTKIQKVVLTKVESFDENR